MSLSPGQQLGPYEITGRIGAGGMGEVYSARDLRLGRNVAIKVLPHGFAESEQSRLRFEREARTIAQLTHPNICTLYDVGVLDSTSYLVMELMEGESLAERLKKGKPSLSEALSWGAQIADALATAHRAGVIHRDVKPGNVMITRTGAKLLDFGLAKLSAGVLPSPDSATVRQTESEPLTDRGTIVGTFQYMSPEQLEGVNVDSRTDIFALGSLLYEMVTGRRAFDGRSRTSIIAAIVAGQPAPIRELSPVTPAPLEHLIERCLAKNADDRWQSASDVAAELRFIRERLNKENELQRTIGAPQRRLLLAAIAATVLLIGLASWLLIRSSGFSADQAELLSLSVAAPPEDGFRFTGDDAGALSISPDGRFITFATAVDGVGRLWLRSIETGATRPIGGTEDAKYPFWSPDSTQLGFFSSGKLKTVAVAGGPVQIVCDATDARGGTWGDGFILFAPHWRDGIFRVPSTGGKPVRLTTPDAKAQETTHRWPHLLDDGERFIYLAGTHLPSGEASGNAIYLSKLTGGERTMLVRSRANAAVAAGHLIYVRDEFLVAQPIDTAKGTLAGQPVTMASGVRYESSFFSAVFAATSGLLVFQSGDALAHSVAQWYAADGTKLETLGDPVELYDVVLDPTGARAVTSERDTSDLWLHDLRRNIKTRFTTDPLNDVSPAFSTDGTLVYYSSDRSGDFDIYRRRVDGSSEERMFADTATDEIPTSVSPSGDLLFDRLPELGNWLETEVWLLSANGGKPRPFIASPGRDSDARFSPDGRWVAYSSTDSGPSQINIRSFPDGAKKQQISSSGGFAPRWSRDGKLLYFLQPDGTVMSTAFESPDVGTPIPLFRTRPKIQTDYVGFYDVAPDGRLLVNEVIAEKDLQPLTVLVNWQRRLAPENDGDSARD